MVAVAAHRCVPAPDLRRAAGFCSFELPVEQRYIAARLSMTPATFSRALAELSAVGVEAKRRKIVISDVDRLLRFVNEDQS